MATKCEGVDGGECNRKPVPTERFCVFCRRIMLNRMEDAGYFAPVEKADEPSRFELRRQETAECLTKLLL
jgi:hypothetical protein